MPDGQKRDSGVKWKLGAASTAPRQPLPPPKASKESQLEPSAEPASKGGRDMSDSRGEKRIAAVDLEHARSAGTAPRQQVPPIIKRLAEGDQKPAPPKPRKD